LIHYISDAMTPAKGTENPVARSHALPLPCHPLAYADD